MIGSATIPEDLFRYRRLSSRASPRDVVAVHRFLAAPGDYRPALIEEAAASGLDAHPITLPAAPRSMRSTQASNWPRVLYALISVQQATEVGATVNADTGISSTEFVEGEKSATVKQAVTNNPETAEVAISWVHGVKR
ncbi:hypothetical protein RW1_022_01360 [Rhodococcus wratislaviensis NBRC 100605]|uniref:Uncharacterized protein n=2 Tax=Rhodococcus wratislaviensis TaxID=44752 RepID=X0Q4W3_RHOWR|nr:hypothetical protein RW1_022_01360 [Rhodococcus wratislaviensis NBRC 100605]